MKRIVAHVKQMVVCEAAAIMIQFTGNDTVYWTASTIRISSRLITKLCALATCERFRRMTLRVLRRNFRNIPREDGAIFTGKSRRRRKKINKKAARSNLRAVFYATGSISRVLS